MKKVLVVIGGAIGFVLMIALFIALAFGGEWFSLKWKSYFAPKHENVRRKVFKETRSYNEAKLQDLTKYRLEYMRAETPEEKAVLASTIRHMFAEYDENRLPLELSQFLRTIKYGG